MGSLALLLCCSCAMMPARSADTAYLKTLASDTWRCIGEMVDPGSGLPYDDSTRGEFTSTSNIGMYLTSVVAACRLGLIGEGERDARLNKTLSSLEKLNTWFGFQQCWNSVIALVPAKHDPWVSVLDSGNLAGALLAVAHASPKHASRCRKLFSAMDWGRFYDGKLLGGYNTQTGKVNPQWHLEMLGTDSRLAQFFAVATGGAPATLWTTLDRSTETRDGETYLRPGWNGGGLFMQFVSGLYVDEKGTTLGDSARGFAKSQIAHAKTIDSPVWGWSASAAPEGGYLGWGAIHDEVVTPHACVLAIGYFPKETLENLRALEKLGARSRDRGFYDAVNWKTGAIAKRFLMLDQSMLLIALANDLADDCVRKWVGSDPTVKRGRRMLPDYTVRSLPRGHPAG